MFRLVQRVGKIFGLRLGLKGERGIDLEIGRGIIQYFGDFVAPSLEFF